MSNLKGTNVASGLTPFSSLDDYATHDALYGKGGYKSVATLAERDKIPKTRLTDGCMVFVRENNSKYVYNAETQTFTKDSEILPPSEELQIDKELSEYSENPVQNAAVTKAILELQKKGGNVVMTQEQYDALKEYSFNMTYVIVKNDELVAIYIGNVRIANNIASNRFPYNLPISF